MSTVTIDCVAREVESVSPYVDPATIVGGGDALAATDTDTYVEFTADNAGIRARFDPIPTAYASLTPDTSSLVVVGYRSSGGTVPPDEISAPYADPADYPWLQLQFDTFYSRIDGLPVGSYAEVVETGQSAQVGVFFSLTCGTEYWTYPDFPAVRLAYLAVRLTYTVASTAIAGDLDTAPVTRLWPRDDKRGISATNRIHPPPRAQRIVGGQP